MAQTTMVNFRMDAEAKKEVEEICSKMGLTMTSAINVFLSKVRMERRIPFEITADADPFYSSSNMTQLKKANQQIKDGRVVVKTIEELETLEGE